MEPLDQLDHLFATVADAAGVLKAELELLDTGAPVFIRHGPSPLFLLAGMHGNERSGPVYLSRLLTTWANDPATMPDRGLVLVPVVNDAGWLAGVREWNGSDLGREWKPTTRIKHMRQLQGILRAIQPTIFWELGEAPGEPYVHGHEPDTHDFASNLAAHLGCGLAWTPPDYDTDGGSEAFAHEQHVPLVAATVADAGLPMDMRLRWLDGVWQYVVKQDAKGDFAAVNHEDDS